MTTTSRTPTNTQAHHAARDLLPALGGADNIRTVDHCLTRLRLTLTDPTHVHDEQLRAHPAVQGLHHADTLHIVLGPAATPAVAHALHHLTTEPPNA